MSPPGNATDMGRSEAFVSRNIPGNTLPCWAPGARSDPARPAQIEAEIGSVEARCEVLEERPVEHILPGAGVTQADGDLDGRIAEVTAVAARKWTMTAEDLSHERAPRREPERVPAEQGESMTQGGGV